MNTVLPPLTTKALKSAAHEFVYEHNWQLENGDGVPEPFEESQFYEVLVKHLAPVLNIEEYKALRIEALKTELKVLEENKP